ncbi:hypothetical protein PoB_004043900 [Plakobranchus ocellatus]|uniref:Uncharacterized protein n=1 Tax=Plakobranchus ocellatus TaxID=259542 RepID=A0AAV4B6E1_9GAST|nr:hypothetical protein PoB_004043900 [Plakobranchus ocellatus]
MEATGCICRMDTRGRNYNSGSFTLCGCGNCTSTGFTVCSHKQCGNVAASSAQGPERTDLVLRDFDEYLSSTVTITNEEKMDQGEESFLTQVTWLAERMTQAPPTSEATTNAFVLAKDPPEVTHADRPKVLALLDGHFHLDRLLERKATVS